MTDVEWVDVSKVGSSFEEQVSRCGRFRRHRQRLFGSGHQEWADGPPHVWPDKLQIRDTRIIPDDGGGRIYTTVGFGYEKREYVRGDLYEEAVAAQKPQDFGSLLEDRPEGYYTPTRRASRIKAMMGHLNREIMEAEKLGVSVKLSIAPENELYPALMQVDIWELKR